MKMQAKTLTLGVVALSAIASSPAVAQQNIGDSDESALYNGDVSLSSVPPICKADPFCPKNPLPKNPRKPIPKNIVDGTPEDLLNSDQTSFETAKTLQCLHFVEAHIGAEGLRPVSQEDLATAEECLNTFAQGLLE